MASALPSEEVVLLDQLKHAGSPLRQQLTIAATDVANRVAMQVRRACRAELWHVFQRLTS
jgi:hypothetical protein